MATSTEGGPTFRPTKEELRAAYDRGVDDVIAPGLTVLFCGINPGLYSAATGHHFARPGNRFWKALWKAGFTPRLLRPHEEQELLMLGLGVTNLVARATAVASELRPEELVAGRARLEDKVRLHRPRYVAVLGLGAFRTAFGAPRAGIGQQPEVLGESRLWVLPSPSGLNGHYQVEALAELLVELRRASLEQ
ncbi:MAG TPA: G/U mismatch-specific DNA glycosylase [Anaerolineae bacterium]|nr:G/U mismatch-specific DNA glycosylase [Anaerolineae bacterium]